MSLPGLKIEPGFRLPNWSAKVQEFKKDTSATIKFSRIKYHRVSCAAAAACVVVCRLRVDGWWLSYDSLSLCIICAGFIAFDDDVGDEACSKHSVV